MMRQRKRPLRLDRPNIVGVVESKKGLKAVTELAAGVLDAVEVRLDLLGRVPQPEILEAIPLPIIATVRSEREGGSPGLDDEERIRLYNSVLGLAKAIDVELSSLPDLLPVVAASQAAGMKVVASYHDFETAPDRRFLQRLGRDAKKAGADVLKIACTPATLRELTPLAEFLEEAPIRVAAMAMGRFGKVSRLLFGSAGSVLNYGWIERPVVPGQWAAAELRVRLDELQRKG